MTNSEIIDILDDITWNGCGRYEKEVMIECRSAAISALEESDKLKAEIEQLNGIISRDMDKHECYVISKSIEVNNLKIEIEQLKSELEQSVRLPCKIGDEFYCIAYEENPRVVKVFCDGYGIIRNNITEPEQKFFGWQILKNNPIIGKLIFLYLMRKCLKIEKKQNNI